MRLEIFHWQNLVMGGVHFGFACAMNHSYTCTIIDACITTMACENGVIIHTSK